MKHIATFIAAAALAGCANLPGQNEPPHYDRASRTVVAPGYPVERIRNPAAHFLVESASKSGRVPHARTGDQGHASVDRRTFAWSSEARTTSVLAVDFISVGPGSQLLPLSGSDGYEFVGDNRVLYHHEHGRYTDIIPAESLIPADAPDCAFATQVAITSRDGSKRVIGTYAEGIGCEERLQLAPDDFASQRTRAYIAMDL